MELIEVGYYQKFMGFESGERGDIGITLGMRMRMEEESKHAARRVKDGLLTMPFTSVS